MELRSFAAESIVRERPERTFSTATERAWLAPEDTYASRRPSGDQDSAQTMCPAGPTALGRTL